jgi:hypothetical protein
MPHPRRSTRKLLLALPVLLAISGCSTIDHYVNGYVRDSGVSSGHLTTSGVNQLFAEDPFEQIDLLNLLDPDRMRYRCPPSQNCEIPPSQEKSPVDGQPKAKPADNLERAFRAFYDPNYGTKRDLMDRRNRVQDRILAASEQRCNAYKTYLQRVQSQQEATFGSLTTVLAGAGAIVTGESVARLLAGLAGISSGVGAEFKQAYFSNLASRIIVPAIEKRRRSILLEIEASRTHTGHDGVIRQQPVWVYTVERAVQDADRFHGACSLVSGIDEAAVSINPGLKAMGQTLADWRNVTTLANPATSKPDASAALAALLKGSAGNGGVATETSGDAYLAAVAKLATAFKELDDSVMAASIALNIGAETKTDAGNAQANFLKDGKAAIEPAQKAANQQLNTVRDNLVVLETKQGTLNQALLTADAKNKVARKLAAEAGQANLASEIDKLDTCVDQLAKGLGRLGQAAVNRTKTPLDATWLAQMQALNSGMAPYGCP